MGIEEVRFLSAFAGAADGGDEAATEIHPFSAADAERLLTTMREHFPRWHPWLLGAFRTGLRAGELIALQWGDIDWHGRFVMVQTADTGQTYTVQISTAKRNTWQTVGFALREAPVEIDRQALGLSQEVLVRITSIDGFTSVSTERRFKAMVL